MEVVSTEIPDVRIVTPARFADPRGFFSETYNRRAFAEAGIDLDFVQDNHSHSAERGTLRGLHFQCPPCAQDKLVRVVKGAILDVAVDLRRSSPTFGRHVRVELSAQNWRQLLVPVGFAHGFLVLQPDTEVIYKVTHYYSREHERGIRWDDADLQIDWPVSAGQVVLSEKDRVLPSLRDARSQLFD